MPASFWTALGHFMSKPGWFTLRMSLDDVVRDNTVGLYFMSSFIVPQHIETSFCVLAVLLLPPLHDKAVSNSMFGRQPDSGSMISPWWSFYLQSAGDFFLSKPASILQLQVVHIQLEQTAGHMICNLHLTKHFTCNWFPAASTLFFFFLF